MPFLKNNLWATTGVVLALIFGVGAGYSLRTATHRAAEPAPGQADAEAAGQVGKPRILPDTQVEMTYSFLLCGHELTQTGQNAGLIGCTLEDVMQKLPHARVVRLDAKSTVIEQELACYCPAHYLLYLEEGLLHISHTDTVEPGREHVQTIAYDSSVLSDEMVAELTEGVVFADLEAVNEYLEGADG